MHHLQAINHACQQNPTFFPLSSIYPLTNTSVSIYPNIFTTETSEIRASSEDSTKLLGEMMDSSQSSKNNDPPEINSINSNDSNHTIANNNTSYQLADNMMVYYFENNNVPFEINFVQDNAPLYDQCQEYQNNNLNSMIYQNPKDQATHITPMAPITPITPITNSNSKKMNDFPISNFDQNSWQQSECDMYQQQQTPEIYCPMMEGSYPNFPIDPTMHNSYPSVIFNDTPTYNFTYNRRSQNYISSPAIYETDYQARSQATRIQSSNSMGNQKPPVYTKWTEEEDELLRAAISIYGPHKWSLIAAHVPNRTPMQCSTRWLGALNPTIHKGRWTPEEDASLRDAVSEFVDLLDSEGHPQPIPWNKIAARIPHRTGIQCQARWSEALDPSVRKGKWSPDEDEILKGGVRRFGRCWIRIAELIDGRTQRQCRTRWVQIKNKQEKIEKDAMATKASSVTSNSSSTEDDESDDSIVMITPPSTPAQNNNNNNNKNNNTSITATSIMSEIFSTSTISPVNRINTIPSKSLTLPRRHISSIITNESPILSPTDTLVTSPESCVATPECNTIFDSSNNNNNNGIKTENLMIFNDPFPY